MDSVNAFDSGVSPARRAFEAHAAAAERVREKLATGLRINRGSDDPAGLIVSEHLRALLATFETEVRALQRTDQLATTADGALSEMSDMLIEAEALAVANANDAGLSPEEREANQMQIDSIVGTVNRLAGSAQFNGQTLLDGSLTLHAGDDSLDVDSARAQDLGQVEIDGQQYSLADIVTGGALNTVSGDPAEAVETLSAARAQISSMRGRIGAFQKYTIGSRLNGLGNTMVEIAAANSQIRDADYAKESANAARLRLLEQSSLQTMGLERLVAENVLNLLD